MRVSGTQPKTRKFSKNFPRTLASFFPTNLLFRLITNQKQIPSKHRDPFWKRITAKWNNDIRSIGRIIVARKFIVLITVCRNK